MTRYLEAVAEALRPASRRSSADDVASFPPAARDLRAEHRAAARPGPGADRRGHRRAGAFRQVSAAFVGEVVTATMRRITTGEISTATGLNDAEAYAELARLVVAAVRR